MRYHPPPQASAMHAQLESGGFVARIQYMLGLAPRVQGVSDLMCWVVEERSGDVVDYKIVVYYKLRLDPTFPGRHLSSWAEAVFAVSTKLPFGPIGSPRSTQSEVRAVQAISAGSCD